MKPTGPTNPILKNLIEDLRSKGYKENIKFLIRLAELLEKSRRRKVEVNLSKLERVCKENETVVIPGKVLSYGILTKPLTVSAFKFSPVAKEKIKNVKGKILTINQLIEKNPKGTNVRTIC